MSVEQLKVEKTVTLLETMEDETLVKLIDFTPADSIDAALKLLGNDQLRLLTVINSGLEQELKNQARESADGWHTYEKDGAGENTDAINGPFTGDILDSKKISGMVLTFAKAFGYSTIKDRDKRRKIKDDAKAKVKTLLQSDPEMKKAFASSDEEDTAKAEAK